MISRTALETIGVALCIAVIGGISSLFHVYNAQEAFAADLIELRAETERQWAQVFALKDAVYETRLDFYRTLYNGDPAAVPQAIEKLRSYRTGDGREVHKPER